MTSSHLKMGVVLSPKTLYISAVPHTVGSVQHNIGIISIPSLIFHLHQSFFHLLYFNFLLHFHCEHGKVSYSPHVTCVTPGDKCTITTGANLKSKRDIFQTLRIPQVHESWTMPRWKKWKYNENFYRKL